VSVAGGNAGDRNGYQLPAVHLAADRLPNQAACLIVCEPDELAIAAVRAAVADFDVEVVVCPDGARTLLEAGMRRADLVLLAATIPVLAAETVIRTLRQVANTPVVVGVGEGEGEMAADALAAGASRILPRPYQATSLRHALTGLATGGLRPGPLRRGALVADPLAYEVTLHGRRVPMPARELEVLMYLMRHTDRVVTVAELGPAIWPVKAQPRGNAVAAAVLRLRSRLGASPGGSDVIHTIRRGGYRLVPPDRSP